MAIAAIKSTTERTPVPASSASSTNDSTSSRCNFSSHRRSQSLNRFSRRNPARDTCNGLDESLGPRGRFVNTASGSGFPSDLAVAFFESCDRGRSTPRRDKVSPASATPASQRRGRSASSRRTGVANDGNANACESSGGKRLVSDANPRRRRSVSMVRCQISDSESDMDHFHSAKGHLNAMNSDIGCKLLHKPIDSGQKSVLRKSLNQKDLSSCDGYSNYDISIFSLRNRQSEKCKQVLLAKITSEEKRCRELSEVIKELLLDSKSMAIQKPSRTRKVH
ncbi:uncharacterized protein LOC129319746 [Prosopis cineraria]|uniref:uncharacterized protein LOC129319746 n=1 Tax=Prosopis cineraria TaxID=364024 RepID=UPI00240EF7A0|nr:uncharacterized protein LOC129319746 [Prosopis cineraria]